LKVLFIDNLYSAVLDNLDYFKKPDTKDSHESLNEHLNSQKFAAASMLSVELNKLGHESKVVFSNALKSQIAWMRESGLSPGRSFSIIWRWWQVLSRLPFVGIFLYNRTQLVKTFMRQVENYKPDFVYCVNINILNSKLIRQLKDLGVSVIGQIASPLPPKRFYLSYDHIFSAHPGQVKTFQDCGVSSSWLPLAFDRAHFEEVAEGKWPERTRDVSFVGTFGRHQKNTGPLMQAIAAEIPGLEIFTFASQKAMKKMGLEKNYKGPAWGPKMHRIMAESKVVINRHGKVADGYAVNYRLFEATGMGALLITENGKNISDLFEPEIEVVTYSSVQDAVSKIESALNDPSRSAEIANKGQVRTLSSHTFANRAQQVVETLIAMPTPTTQTDGTRK
jgi:spore maturation protein CgeB